MKIMLIIALFVFIFCIAKTKNDGWICTSCGKEHGYWTGRCWCGEVRLINGET